MIGRRVLATVLALLAGANLHATTNCRQPAAVCDTAVAGALALVDHAHPVGVLADAHDYPGVLRAARDLQSDLARVAGNTGTFSTTNAHAAQPTAIIVGTLGKSARIDRIVRERHIDTSSVKGRWEAYLLQVVEHPEPGIDRALLIAGADKRGTIFGIYELSRRIGVSPWYWWADVPVSRQPALYVAPGRLVDAPAVRWRGIFLNDEDPALGGWMKAKFGGPNHAFYQHVFELILRLKGNTLWPAMWGRAFADDDPQNPVLADEYGVVVGTSHHEPMMRAHVEWQRYGKGPWDYAKNADALRAFWRRGIERMDGHESLVTIGMRGDGDEPMTQGTAIGLLERIVADQRRIISDVTGKPAAQTPQVWALYKEVQDYFDAGMRVPDDVTLLFSDDNWGNLRRLPQPGSKRSGGYGIYYHFDYVGGPRNYKWVDSTQIERVWEQMRLAYAYGADRLWIANVGDLKPLEFPVSFFLDLAWNPQAMTAQQLEAYPAGWAAQQFGAAHAAEASELLTRYTQYNARRKPELLSPDTYSLVNFHEAARVEADWQALAERTQRLGDALPPAWHDAWYELLGYPILASANLNALYLAVARNRLYSAQGRATANAQAALAQRLFARDAELAHRYETDVAGGKWPSMMAQTHIGYTGWQQPETNVMPQTTTLAVPDTAAMGVAVEGDTRAWPGAAGTPRLPPLDPFGATSRTVTVFDRGRRPVRYTATATQAWLRVTPSKGETGGEQTLRIEADWAALPPGERVGRVTLRGSDGSVVPVDVPVSQPADRDAVHGYIETDGHIAIEAAHHARAVAAPGLAWQTIPNLGRTLSGVTLLPARPATFTPGGDSPHLEYPLWLREPGDLTVRVVLSPALDVLHRGGSRFAVSLDDGPPQVVTLDADPTPGGAGFAAWERAVSDGVQVAVSRRHVARGGAHTLKIWPIDPGLVFQRIEVVHGELPPSYLGPPESPYR